MSESKITTDHKEIKKWVEDRCGWPSSVASMASKDDPGLLRIDFNEKDEALEEISWDEFFRKFDESELAFLYQDETEDGEKSRFYKFVSR